MNVSEEKQLCGLFAGAAKKKITVHNLHLQSQNIHSRCILEPFSAQQMGSLC